MLPRLCYFAFKADLKARHQCHLFDQYYLCKLCCDRCEAVKPTTSEQHEMTFKNMSPTAPYVATCKDHSMYLRSCRRVSPWNAVPGWQLESVSYDIMHCIFLGVARDHIPSVLKMLQLLGCCYVAGESDDEFLKRVSMEMKQDCKAAGPLVFSFCNLVIRVFPHKNHGVFVPKRFPLSFSKTAIGYTYHGVF